MNIVQDLQFVLLWLILMEVAKTRTLEVIATMGVTLFLIAAVAELIIDWT